jgi:hypothetical protein
MFRLAQNVEEEGLCSILTTRTEHEVCTSIKLSFALSKPPKPLPNLDSLLKRKTGERGVRWITSGLYRRVEARGWNSSSVWTRKSKESRLGSSRMNSSALEFVASMVFRGRIAGLEPRKFSIAPQRLHRRLPVTRQGLRRHQFGSTPVSETSFTRAPGLAMPPKQTKPNDAAKLLAWHQDEMKQHYGVGVPRSSARDPRSMGETGQGSSRGVLR